MIPLPELPDRQSAVTQGPDGELIIADNVTVPDVTPETILVKTSAVALGPYDYKMPMYFPTPGAIGGSDIVGTVVRLGEEAARLRPELGIGDIVYGCVYAWNAQAKDVGSFAQYCKLPAHLVYRATDRLERSNAATFGAALATMIMALWASDALALTGNPEQPVVSPKPVFAFVFGGSTATGTMALQLLKLCVMSHDLP